MAYFERAVAQARLASRPSVIGSKPRLDPGRASRRLRRRGTTPASALTLPDPRGGPRVSAYMIRSLGGSEAHAGDQHDLAVQITLSAVKRRAGWQPGPRPDLALDHVGAGHCP